MGVVIRKDSPYYWLTLPRKGERCIREATRILVDGGSAHGTARNRQLADEKYRLRMLHLAEGRDRAPERPSKALISNVRGLVYVYFVGDGELIKIGRTVNMESRLSSLQTSHHEKLELLALAVGDHKSESLLHGHFKRGRKRGEWFHRDTPGLLDLIDIIKTNPGLPLPMAWATYRARRTDAVPGTP